MNRLITAVGLLIVAFYLIFWAPQFIFLAAALLMSLLCYREYADLVAGHAIRKPGLLGVAGGLILLFFSQYAVIGITLLVLAAFLVALRAPDLKLVLPQVACALLGAFYTFGPWHFAVELRAVSVHLLFFALALNWAGDSIAYYVGRSIGKHRLAPVVSPKKSWEGAIAAVLAAIVFGLVYLGYFLPSVAWWKVVILTAIANVAGQLGDLAESAVKRGAGVKDSGSLLPGHGGMLDRVDSSLFALPVVYILYVLLSGLKIS